ncbi:sensor histidine kinase [Shewanella intestini]|uniref:histidine kinase n=1 Tax=Shewanella intestini TaxID=2017544 RepID=A0ABS5I332_9GAMM|nr:MULTISPECIES: HAMP domain-containing sensor histidine kinase [Shewanella]MBR9728432.1 HAMP domain-containing histidine kinase [Shewanella intestini]MRG36774.1 sensor histidine kinase [Shewanella sp. XMDDZSB0408]
MRKINLFSTRTLTGQLGIFFMSVAFVMGLASYITFYATLHWSEDKAGERRIEIDKNEAVQRFMNGEKGKITIDVLTSAYDDINLIPDSYHRYLENREEFVGEVGVDSESRMLYFGHYIKDGTKKPVILLSDINQIEFGPKETLFSSAVIITTIAGMFIIFGALLSRLSQRLIAPLNHLTNQLTEYSGNSTHIFDIPAGGAQEFQILANQLNTDRREIHSLVKREQAFARYASHELRTPLTIVKGASKLLERDSSTEFQKRQTLRINLAINQMSTMVDALLGLVRYERSQDDSATREVSHTEFQTIIDNNRAQANAKNIEVELLFHSSPYLNASLAVLNIIVGNLIRNAIAASEEGKVTLNVCTDSITVEDNGPGLNHSTNDEGHGLGLLIVNDLCHRYAWTFSIENRKPIGCIATITVT